MKKTLICLSFILLNNLIFGQSALDISSFGDCNSILKINIEESPFGPTTPPDGYGKVLEFKDNTMKDPMYIQKEHNTVWYKFEIPSNGKLSFDIIPIEPKDDYDFMLFSVEGDNVCASIQNKSIKPIRTNISRNDKTIGSKTGLKFESTNKFQSSGIGASYSQGLIVTEGETYILLLDNVYKNGNGHTIVFDYQKDKPKITTPTPPQKPKTTFTKPKKITKKVDKKIDYTRLPAHMKPLIVEGTVVDENGNPIDAEVTLLELKSGEVITKIQADSLGQFSIEEVVDIRNRKRYGLDIFKDGHFFDSKVFTSKEIITLERKKLQFVTPKLQKGKNYVVKNINFYGGIATIVSTSYPTVKNLRKLMKRNKTLVIKIEGHTNGCGEGKRVTQKLSEDRCLAVIKYLASNGIDKDRMSYQGFNCEQMLYPKPQNEKEMELNRRVEIKIIDF